MTDLACLPRRCQSPRTKWVILVAVVVVGHALAIGAFFAPEWKTVAIYAIRGLIAIQVPLVGLVYLQRMLSMVDERHARAQRSMVPTEDHELYMFCALFFCTALGLATLVMTR